MRYLPSKIKLVQEGIVVKVTGFDDYHDGKVVMDLHGAFGKYELEEEFASLVVTLFNNFATLQKETSLDYNMLQQVYNELKNSSKRLGGAKS